MRSSSICSNDVCQNIARGVSPFAHVHSPLESLIPNDLFIPNEIDQLPILDGRVSDEERWRAGEQG